MVNSQLIFSKRKIFLSGNILGKDSNFLTTENNYKIYFTKRLSDISNVIGITQHNLANNVTINGKQNKTFIHKSRQIKNIKLGNDLATSGTYKTLSYIDPSLNYLFDGCFNYMGLDYSTKFTMYFNYKVSSIPHLKTVNSITEIINLNKFLNFLTPFTIYDDLQINSFSSHSQPPMNMQAITVSNGIIRLNIQHPSKKPIRGINDDITSYNNQIILRSQYLLNSPSYLDIDYIHYNSKADIYYLYPFVENIDVSHITIKLLQLEEYKFNLQTYLIETSRSFSLFKSNLILSNSNSNTYYLHYNNKIIPYKITDILYNNGNFEITIKSLNRLFVGELILHYTISFSNNKVQKSFTIKYNIVCNPYLCPLPAFPNRISQISIMGAANSMPIHFSNKIRNASYQNARKTKFIKK